MPHETTAQSVIERFAVSSAARAALELWIRQRPNVSKHVLAHVTRTPYAIEIADLRRVAESTEHALGNTARRVAESVVPIRDWNPAFAMTHVLHYALETLGAPFTYQDFRAFCRDDSSARQMLWYPAIEAIEEAARTSGASSARAAMRWRIGNAFYSFLRELVALCELRLRHVDLEIHPLADALFRVDAWSGQTAVGLYIGNRTFRDGSAGRKPQPDAMLGPTFDFVTINMPTQHTFGRLHVPAREALDAAASMILAAAGRERAAVERRPPQSPRPLPPTDAPIPE